MARDKLMICRLLLNLKEMVDLRLERVQVVVSSLTSKRQLSSTRPVGSYVNP